MEQLAKLRNEFLINKVVRLTTFGREDRVLQIGPQDGLLFELIHGAAGECHGVEPDAATSIRLSQKLRHRPNVLIQHARATNLPFPRSYFTRIIFHDVAAHVQNELEMRRILEEIHRVSRNDAVIFVGGVSMAPEQDPTNAWRRIIDHFSRVTRSVREHGRFRLAVRKGWKPKAAESHGPLFSEDRFLSLCRQYGLVGAALRTELIHSLSKTRNDFLLHPAGSEMYPEEGMSDWGENERQTLQESQGEL